MSKYHPLATTLAVAGLLFSINAHADESAKEPDNGTDPTRLNRYAWVDYEHTDLRGGFSSDVTELIFAQPFGEKKNFALRATLPVSRVDALGNDDFAIGDAVLRLSHLPLLTRAYGILLFGEMIFDTAQRPELGTGKNVFKGSMIYARFLQGGDIFAPTVAHSASLGGDHSRPSVSSTVLDFYYVPKFADPRTFMTLDPALTFDWEGDKQFASLAVTLGRSLGPAFGGNSVIYIKPTVYAGTDRPGNWGVEIGYKVIGF